jgi:predicted permease
MNMFSSLWRDLVFATRSLAKARAFTFVCVVSLGIGMAPVIAVPYASHVFNTAITPPGIRTDGLVEVFTTSLGPREAANSWSYADFMDLRAADTGMAITGWANGASQYTIETPTGVETRSVSTKFVSANYFSTFGVVLPQGRGFDATMDDPLRAEPAVILGHDFWQQQLGADPEIVGKRLQLDGRPTVVVGVAPDLAFDERQLFIPIEQHPLLRDGGPAADKVRSDRSQEWIQLHGRLSPGGSVAQANAAVGTITSRLASQFPATNQFKAGAVADYDPIGVLQRPQFRILQTVALTLTGLVLLVVCLNISGMMLVRYAMRERELSVRQAIGASRGQLLRHLLSEAVILAALGGTMASLVLFNIPPLVMWLSDATIPAQLRDAMSVDPYMLAVCVALCLVTSVLCGWLPARRFSRPAIISSLKDDAGVGGLKAGRVHRFTAALQVAIAVPLIVMAGISLDRIRATAMNDLGFAAEDLHAAQLGLDGATQDAAGFRIRAAQDTLRQGAGVVSVTVADGLPLDFGGRLHRVSLQTTPDVAPRFLQVHTTRVGDDYLHTMGIPLLRGRGFSADDRPGGERVTIISKTLADELFPDVDAAEAIGRRLMFDDEEEDEGTEQTLTIVGVTADFPTSQMSTERSQLLLPLAQHPAPAVFLIARSAAGAPPDQMAAALENAVRDLAPDAGGAITTGDGVRYARVITGAWLRENSMRDFLTQSTVAGGAGGVILLLSALGIYGVVGLMVATRTREIAVRVALGASRRRVIGMILFDVVKLVTPGIGIGLLLTVALMRLNSENMGIPLSQVENLAYVAGAAVALLVAVLASVLPARRASSIQPMVAMRSQ